MLQAIKKLINTLNQTNLTLSQYQNFQLWLIKIKETKTRLTLEVWTSSGSEDSENTIATTIELAITDEIALNWCYESLLLAAQQTTEKEIFWKKIMQQATPLYQLELSSNLYLLTKEGIHFFDDKIVAFELNYYNYNILIILFAWQKINMGINIKKRTLIKPNNLPLKINQQLNTLNLTIYKLLLIEGTLFYQYEIDWLSKMGKYMIKSATTIYYQQEFTIKTNILSELLQLIEICNNLNDRILAYFRALLLLTHQQQLFTYDKHKDYWTLTKLGQKLFYQIDYKNFIIKNEMMKVYLQRGI